MLSLSCKRLLLSLTPLVVCAPVCLHIYTQVNTPVLAQEAQATQESDAPPVEKVVDKAAQKAAARKAWLIKKAALNRVAAARAAKLKAAQAAALKAGLPGAAGPTGPAASPATSPAASPANPVSQASPTGQALTPTLPGPATGASVPAKPVIRAAIKPVVKAQARPATKKNESKPLAAQGTSVPPMAEIPAKKAPSMPMAGSQAAREAAALSTTGSNNPSANTAGSTAASAPGNQVSSPANGQNPGNTATQQTSEQTVAPHLPPPQRIVPRETIKKAQSDAATRSGAGDYLGAIAAWSKFILHGNTKNGHEMSRAYLERARLKRHIGDYNGAGQDLDLGLQAMPQNVACLLERAAIKRKSGDNHGALKDLDQAIAIDPHKAEPFVDRGWLKMAMGDYVGSYTDYHAAITIDPNLKNKLAGMAQPQVSGHIDMDPTGAHSPDQRDQNNQNQREFAHGDFKHVDKYPTPHPTLSAPNLSQAELVHLNNTAVKQINERQFEAAVKTLTYLLSSAPDYHHALENLCIAHNNWGLELAKRTPTEAATQFRLALYLDPSQGASRRNLEAMLREVGKSPRNADDRLSLSRELLISGHKEEAFVEAIESLKLKNDSGARNVMRQVLSSIDNEDSHLADSEKLTPGAPTAYHSSDITDSVNAVIEQTRALSASGQHAIAEELLTRLIGDIKARAAVEESGDVGNLEKALAAIADIYQKAGNSYQAQKYRIELASLKETIAGSTITNKAAQAPTPPAVPLSSPDGN